MKIVQLQGHHCHGKMTEDFQLNIFTIINSIQLKFVSICYPFFTFSLRKLILISGFNKDVNTLCFTAPFILLTWRPTDQKVRRLCVGD